MAVVGIIAEFNPLHLGHKMIIDTVKSRGDTAVCAISGNFVQRGDTAIISKFKRAEAALKCGADLVCEIPVLWSMSTAQNFAIGGVWQLYNLGCERIIFGSECGDINSLYKAADILESKEFKEKLTVPLKEGITFAKAREAAALELGLGTEILRGANNNLGIEYISAARKMKLDIDFECVKRIGENHDSEDDGEIVSASFIREKIKLSEAFEKYLPSELHGFITEDAVSDISLLESAILSTLRSKSANEFRDLPDISEGLHNKIYFASRVATSLDMLYNEIKSKRYTLARIRRLVLSAFLGFDNSLFLKAPPYTRVLGFKESGTLLLKSANPRVPIVTKTSQIEALGEKAKKVFLTEARATDLYSLSLKKPQECGAEYKTKLIKME